MKGQATGSEPAALQIRYDADADAMYVRVRDGTVAETVEIEEMVYVDVDDEGCALGVEFVVASDLLAFLNRHDGEFVLPARVDRDVSVLVR